MILQASITVVVAALLFGVGLRAASKDLGRYGLAILLVAGAFLSVPALLYAAYYLHILDRQAWFFELRSLPYSELLAAAAGLFFGSASGVLCRTRVVNDSQILKFIVTPLFALFLFGILLMPFAKPVIAPMRIAYTNHWSNGVCLQTTPSTCGPSSAATILNHFGTQASEQELAGECNTCGSGTEIWYLTRALRRRGLHAEYSITLPSPQQIPTPCICGTQLGRGGAGHFIAVLGQNGDRYTIGDPIGGRTQLSMDEIKRRYYITGFFLKVSR